MTTNRQINIINGFINGAIGDLQVTFDRYDNTNDQELLAKLQSLDNAELLDFVENNAALSDDDAMKVLGDHYPIDQVTNELSSSLFDQQQLELFHNRIVQDARAFYDEVIGLFEQQDDIPSNDAEYYEFFSDWLGDYLVVEGGYGLIR